MSLASGSRVRVAYIAEVTRGTTPSISPGDTTILRVNSSELAPDKTLLKSEEVRPDREIITSRHGQKSVSGPLVGELMLQNHDDFIEAALSGTWAAVTASNNIGVTNPNTIVCSSNTFITDGFLPGMIVTLGGLAVSADDGDYRVLTVAAGAITVAELDGTAAALTTEAENATPTFAMKGKVCKVGTTLRTFSIERGFLDIAQYMVFRGCAVNTMDISIQPDAIPGITFNMIGMGFDDWASSSFDSAPTAAPTNEGMSPFDGRVWENGAPIAIITGLDISLNNNRELEAVVGATESPDVFEGDSMTSGTVTMLFQDATQASKFVNETETKIWMRLPDPDDATAFLNICMNRVKLNGGAPTAPRTGPVTLSMPFEALYDATNDITSFFIQRSNA